MSQRWFYALLAVLIGCSSSPSGPGPVGTDADTDVAEDSSTKEDVTPSDTGGGQDVVDAGRDVSADVARDVAADASTDVSADVSDLDATGDAMVDVSVDAPADVSVDAPVDVSADAPVDVSADAPADVSADVPADVGGACPTPRGTITLPGTPANITGTTSGRGIINTTSCRSNAMAPENVYTLVVTERTLVTLSTDNPGTDFDTILSVRRNCADLSSEVLCNDDASGATALFSSRIRGVLEAGTYTLIVDGYDTEEGDYELSAVGVAPAANGTCMSATTLTTAGLTGQNLGGASVTPTTCLTSGGGQLFYSVTVPATSMATVRVTPAGTPTWTPVIRVLNACDATTCAGSVTGSSGMPTSLTFANEGAAPRTFIVSVNASSATVSSGTFGIALSTTPIGMGGACGSAVELTPGMTRTGESTTGGGPASTVCQTSGGPQRWYRVSVPPGQRLNTTVTPAAGGGRSAILRYLDICDATVCRASTPGATNMPSTLGLNNVGTTARTVYISVSSDSTSMPLTYDIQAALTPVVPSSACDAPAALADGVPTMGDTARGLLRPTRCNTTDMGMEVYYTVVVPPQRRVTVVAQPATGATWRPRLRGVTTCASTGCFNSSVATTDGGPATMALDNPTLLPRTMIVTVSPTTTATGGAFTITATAAALPTPPMPYHTFTSITASCDDVSSGTVVAPSSGWMDDSASSVAALPFTFRFFGEDTSYFSVTSNGFAQLWSLATATPSTAYSNATIPNSGAPNNFVAPFWDDLSLVDASTSNVRTATLGTAPNRRFVIAWNNWRTLGSATTERLTFQAKLFETTGVIEYHYCTINASGTRGNGDSATIGAEDGMGMRGTLIAQDYPDVVSTGVGFRLTPR